MITTFQDLQYDDNPRNGQVVSDRSHLMALLNQLRTIRPPSMCQFIGNNGCNLTVGIDQGSGCVQHSTNDGAPPYLMAIGRQADNRQMQFVVGGTETPIDGRYRLPFDILREVVANFVATGERSSSVLWEEFAPN
jgi:hypothetical protein